jgi:hypothetical protein
VNEYEEVVKVYEDKFIFKLLCICCKYEHLIWTWWYLVNTLKFKIVVKDSYR